MDFLVFFFGCLSWWLKPDLFSSRNTWIQSLIRACKTTADERAVVAKLQKNVQSYTMIRNHSREKYWILGVDVAAGWAVGAADAGHKFSQMLAFTTFCCMCHPFVSWKQQTKSLFWVLWDQHLNSSVVPCWTNAVSCKGSQSTLIKITLRSSLIIDAVTSIFQPVFCWGSNLCTWEHLHGRNAMRSCPSDWDTSAQQLLVCSHPRRCLTTAVFTFFSLHNFQTLRKRKLSWSLML